MPGPNNIQNNQFPQELISWFLRFYLICGSFANEMGREALTMGATTGAGPDLRTTAAIPPDITTAGNATNTSHHAGPVDGEPNNPWLIAAPLSVILVPLLAAVIYIALRKEKLAESRHSVAHRGNEGANSASVHQAREVSTSKSAPYEPIPDAPGHARSKLAAAADRLGHSSGRERQSAPAAAAASTSSSASRGHSHPAAGIFGGGSYQSLSASKGAAAPASGATIESPKISFASDDESSDNLEETRILISGPG